MNRERQIKEAALKECSSFDIPDKQVRFKGVNSAYGLGFCEGAMWADANPYINWQQVRIQAAIAAMKGICNSCHDDCIREIMERTDERRSLTISHLSIVLADALVKELKGE